MAEGREFGGFPEKFKEGGLIVHGLEKVVVGDTVEAIADVAGIIPKGTRLRVTELIVEPRDEKRGFTKRLQFEGYEGDFNPQRFRKVNESSGE